MKPTKVLTVTAVMALVIMVAGCGGDNSEGSKISGLQTQVAQLEIQAAAPTLSRPVGSPTATVNPDLPSIWDVLLRRGTIVGVIAKCAGSGSISLTGAACDNAADRHTVITVQTDNGVYTAEVNYTQTIKVGDDWPPRTPTPAPSPRP